MAKVSVTVFLCTGKDCARAWRKLCDDSSPRKWIRQQLKEAKLPFKLNLVKTECMDQCARAGCLWVVYGRHACQEMEVCSAEDGDRVLAAMRACVEASSSPL